MRREHANVVLGLLVIGLAVGLVASAIPLVREAAARAKCDGVKQLGVALEMYAGTNDGRLPCGPPPPPGLPPERRLSWVVETLPFVEANDVYKRFDLTAPADSEQNRAAAATLKYAGHLTCPSSDVFDPVTLGWKDSRRVSHRVGAAGIGADAAELPAGHPRAGAFGYDRRLSLRDGFPDGRASTFLILETGYEPGHWAFSGPATVRPVVPGTAPYIGHGRPYGGFHLSNGWGRPQGGFMVTVMADGSIRCIRGDIDPGVFEALATVNEREALPGEW